MSQARVRARCPHGDRPAVGGACVHVLSGSVDDLWRQFEGRGIRHNLVCRSCMEHPAAAELVELCEECFTKEAAERYWAGVAGAPEVRIRQTGLRFEHQEVELAGLGQEEMLEVRPVEGSESAWVGLTARGALIEIDPQRGRAFTVAELTKADVEFDGGCFRVEERSWGAHMPPAVLSVSRSGELAAVANTYGSRSVVVDLRTGQVVRSLEVEKAEAPRRVSAFSLALCEWKGRPVLIHRTDWNRVDATDVRTGKILTPRGPTSYGGEPEAEPPHYLDYFHGGLSVSPTGEFIADNGWIWHPRGTVVTWNLERWLGENVWESEDGGSRRELCWRDYFWDGPLCWISGHELAVWGYGREDTALIPAAWIFDARTGKEVRWFAGPRGR